MHQYQRLVYEVLMHGEERHDRTGVGTFALFGKTIEFDMRSGFPATTVKKLAFGQVQAELFCFLKAFDDVADFNAAGCTIWNGNGSSDYWKPRQRFPTDLGRIYGVQWRRWRRTKIFSDKGYGITHFDQLRDVIERAKTTPHDRRLLVTAWNPGELDEMCLPPCHYAFQLFVGEKGLSMLVNMRSVDLFLGLPFDIASYGLLLHLIANELHCAPLKLTFMLADTHIYKNHLEAVKEMLGRKPTAPPRLKWSSACVAPDVDSFRPGDAVLVDYAPHAAIKGELNV